MGMLILYPPQYNNLRRCRLCSVSLRRVESLNFFLWGLWLEPRTLCIPGDHSTAQLHPRHSGVVLSALGRMTQRTLVARTRTAPGVEAPSTCSTSASWNLQKDSTSCGPGFPVKERAVVKTPFSKAFIFPWKCTPL